MEEGNEMDWRLTITWRKLDMMSMGTGKTIVLLFSAEIPLRV